MPSGDWVGYYDAQIGREPREVLVRVLERFQREGRVGSAVDLGCGDGTDTVELLNRGWEVVSIDAQGDSIRRVREKIPPEAASRSTTIVSAMEDASLPRSDLVFASFSLPFCHPDAFPDLWHRLRSALYPGGRFAGELFGDRDSWASDPDMTFHDVVPRDLSSTGSRWSRPRKKREDGEAFDGQKHWHVFHVIARRPDES